MSEDEAPGAQSSWWVRFVTFWAGLEKARSRPDTILSLAAVVVTGGVGAWIHYEPRSEAALHALIMLWLCWSLIPPAYFLAEWAVFEHGKDPDKLADLKYSHELASKFWLAGVACLSALLFYEIDVRGEEKKAEAKLVCFREWKTPANAQIPAGANLMIEQPCPTGKVAN